MKRPTLKGLLLAFLKVAPVVWLALFWLLRNPTLTRATPPPMTNLPEAARLESHVRFLAGLQPNRSWENDESLARAAAYVAGELESFGYTVERQTFSLKGRTFVNLVARLGDDEGERVVVGAHYDAAHDGNPGADDNASGVAGLLELARVLKANRPALRLPVELVAYTLEEPPFFGGPDMGSARHAERLRAAGVHVRAMLSLEMIGYFAPEQHYQPPLLYAFYPWRGEYVGVVGNLEHRGLQREIKRAMASSSTVPVYSISAPAALPGVDFSDHRNYWQRGWPAFMITDTAFLRNDQYHKPGDTPERLDYAKMSEVVRGVYAAVIALAGP